MPAEPLCPCGSAREYTACCGPFHAHAAVPDTAEALMRSRYSAFVLNDAAYLLETWHASTRPPALQLDLEQVKWLGLKILATVDGSVNDSTGTVEFIARYKVGGRVARLHEVSRFARQDGRWFYVDGKIPRHAK